MTKTKRTYNRKSQFNKTYKKGKTRATKETEKTVRNLIITMTAFAYLFAGAYSFATNTRTITIQGGSGMVQAVKQATPQSAEGVDNSLSVDEVDYENIPYMTKKGTIEKQIALAFPEDPKTALAIAKCESQLDKTAIGDTHTAYCSVGLFQIRTLPKRMRYYGLTIESLKDIETNLDMARKIKDRRGGWYAWSCWTSGKYKNFL